MYNYKIKTIKVTPEECFIVRVSLDEKDKYIIILKFMNGFINHFIGDYLDEQIESKLKKLLLQNDNLLLIRLTRLALGDESIKKLLRNNEIGIFNISYVKWEQILEALKQEELKVEKEKLEAILEQGLADL